MKQKTSISDIHTFASLQGNRDENDKDVCFVRAIGTNTNYLTDIKKMDDTLLEKMNAGQGYYYRVNSLPKMQSVEDTDFYIKSYDNWVNCGKKEVFIRTTTEQKVLAQKLSDACLKLEGMFKQENKQATDSIVKNFVVKLLFWYDSIFADEKFRYDEKLMVKVVASNVVKKQEYLFFYLVTLMGCHVLLLQSKEDIATEEEKLELSGKFVLGEFADISIPTYQWKETGREPVTMDRFGSAQQGQAGIGSTLNDNGRITVKLPERNRPSKHPAQNPQAATTQTTEQAQAQGVAGTQPSTGNTGSQGNPRVTIPPRPGSSTGSSQAMSGNTGSQGNPRVTIPPRPGSSTGSSQAMSGNTGSQGNPRVTIPPRPGSSTGSSQAMSGNTGSQGNPRVTIPPRPGSSTGSSQATSGNTGNSGATGGNTSGTAIPPRASGAGRPVNITTPARSAAPVAAGAETEKSFEELAMLASSVVLITVYDGKGERLGSGSGIMIGKEGYILTNNHVAAGGRCFSVRIEDDEKEYRTDEIIKYHSVLDLAIIRIQRKLNPIPVYKGSKPLVRGQKVVAIGSPLGLFNSVSDGIISGFRKIDEVDMIQFTAPTSRGSSGGAVLNMQGEVIGISTAGIDAGQNINLAMGYECINMFIRGFI